MSAKRLVARVLGTYLLGVFGGLALGYAIFKGDSADRVVNEAVLQWEKRQGLSSPTRQSTLHVANDDVIVGNYFEPDYPSITIRRPGVVLCLPKPSSIDPVTFTSTYNRPIHLALTPGFEWTCTLMNYDQTVVVGRAARN